MTNQKIDKSMVLHTPGPWKAGVVYIPTLDPAVHFGVAMEDDDSFIVAITGLIGANDEEISIANGRLIAAAPDMLVLLTQIRAAIQYQIDECGIHFHSDFIPKIDQILTKMELK